MVDKALLASKIAAVRDAIERIRLVLPDSEEVFAGDRTAREVVTLNLFVAIQTCLALASHWVADAGWDVPESYAELLAALANHDVLSKDLARRLGAASGLRNLIAHQYSALDVRRLYAIASSNLDDLETFCAALAASAR